MDWFATRKNGRSKGKFTNLYGMIVEQRKPYSLGSCMQEEGAASSSPPRFVRRRDGNLAHLEHLTRNMVELRVTLAVEIAREFGCEDPSYAAIGMS